MTPPRLVLDTNVLLSALPFRSPPLSWLRTAWQSGSILPLASRDTGLHPWNETVPEYRIRLVPEYVDRLLTLVGRH